MIIIRKKTHEEFVNMLPHNVLEEFEIIGVYDGMVNTIKTKHLKCGRVYDARARDLAIGGVCSLCSGKLKKTTKTFKMEVFDLVENEYVVLGQYEGANVNILMKHLHCGGEFKIKPNAFVNRGSRCDTCSRKANGKNLTKSHTQFVEEVSELVGEEYEVIGEYSGSYNKVKLRHLTCGYEYEVLAHGFLTGRRCRKCKESKGEKEIYDYLTVNNISFERQYRYDGCRNIKPLPFDFAIMNELNEVTLLIEYDGDQHFKSIPHFGGKSHLEYVQKNDLIKSTYCKENNIPLLRIPFTKYGKIKEILEESLIYN